jgi:hypothetical protein
MVATNTTLGIGKVLVLQNADELTAEHTLHNLTYTTHDRYGPVTSESGVFFRFENGYYNCNSPGKRQCVLLSYMNVHEEEKAFGSRWEVRRHFIMNTIRSW